ncbi:MAG: hypothetical protein BWX88_01144 [Planctomycetes bacterium ADurb.Bin126]|nr:MAG: hypothetical protein BWX88_01144 [Planctomycetes bacterium ADurb.Bin126]HOD81240.1 hypothetical protein [Phycisphaerae bacterium]HQL71804.1 hypothetical protein [Phycisphaerae bacterium]
MASQITRRDMMAASVAAAGAMAASQAGAADKPAAAPAKEPIKAQHVVPQAKIGKITLGRILLGGNLLTHYTHSRDLKYVYKLAAAYNTPEKIMETISIAEAHGMNATVIHTVPWALDTLKKHREQNGSKLQWIICPTTSPVDTHKYVEHCRQLVDMGADALYFWGVHGDQFCTKPEVIARTVDAVKELGIPYGVGGHKLDVVKACEKAKVNNDFYIKTLHHHNYPSAKLGRGGDAMWCEEPNETVEYMKSVSKTWIAFKVMAAGAIPPRNAYTFAFQSGADFALSGMFDFEIPEDAKIACEVLATVKDRARPWHG